MKVTPQIELFCRKTDAQSFKRIGFTSTATLGQTGANLAATNMISSVVNDPLVSTLIAVGREGMPFTARVVGYEYGLSLLIASYEREVIAVPTAPDWCQPVVQMCEGRLGSTEQAKQYRIVKAKFEAALEKVEETI